MFYAIIAAGGTGLRFGGEKPKQFFEIDNKPIIFHTVQKFEQIVEIRKIIVACPCEWVEYTKNILSSCNKTEVICGGKDRNETVMAAIDHIDKNYGLDDDTYVVTHDAVRPFVTEEIILSSMIDALRYGASTVAVNTVDTVIEAEDGFIKSVPDRKSMYQVQTPQVFPAKKLRLLYNSLSDKEKGVLTDCSRIFISKGEKVKITLGDVKNIKITFRNDI